MDGASPDKTYCVKFSRPDGSQAWLGPHSGAVHDQSLSPALNYEDAIRSANSRNRAHGGQGYRYWIEALKVTKGE